MKFIFNSVFIVFFTCLIVQAQDVKPAGSNSAYIETPRFTSKVFNNTRTVRVLLPPGYQETANAKTKYPVLYLTDGIVVFRRFNLEETVHRLIGAKALPPLIIVGIDNGASTDKPKNAGTDRENEFLPYPDFGFAPGHLYEPDPPNPIGKLFPDFIAEVMAFIKQKYRIKTGAKNTGIGGFSYGGVAALYTAINKPNVFGKLLLESAPLWIGKNKQLLEDTRQIKLWPAKIYVASGTNESPDEAINKEGRADQDILIGSIKKTSPETAVKLVLEEGAKHEASAWGRRFPAALQFLFGN